MLTVKNLTKTFHIKDKVIYAVKNLNFHADKGEIICLLGANGAGKTTTIKMLCGLVTPTEGEIIFNSVSIEERKNYLKKVGAVLEGARNIFWRLTPIENMDLFAKLRGLSGQSLKERINYYSDVMDLKKYLDIECRYLSRGNQQKVAVACALVLNSELLLLDEPTLGLDLDIAQKVIKVLESERSSKKIIIITTHNMEFVEKLADRVIIFEEGRINLVISPNEFVEKYSDNDLRLSSAYLNYFKGSTYAGSRSDIG